VDEVLVKAAWLKEARIDRGWSAAEMARRVMDRAELRGERLTLSQQAISNFENGQTKSIPRWVRLADEALTGEGAEALSTQRRLAEDLFGKATPDQLMLFHQMLAGNATAADLAAESLDLVSVASVDMAYGMGMTFAGDHVDVEVLHFPRAWLASLTSTAPQDLAWARGRGNSMSPTIEDNDLVLIDRSDRSVRDQDAIWAFTIGDVAMMKRLRLRGEDVTILSDNDRVPADHAHPDEINIVGRVSHIVRRI
jgi:phage repressor protein C with HTH and peptisase S24 domain